MNETIITCENCSTEIDAENDVFYGSEINDKAYCSSCYESDLTGASTAFLTGPDYPFTSEGATRILVGDWFIQNQWGDPWTELTFQRTYQRSSAWRGYYETTIDGWTEILGGWTTGGWGDPTADRKAVFNDWAENLFTGEIVPPFNIAVITDPTSNVFSTAIGVFVPVEQADTAEAWLNGELDNLRYALS
jgi:hypothetical protein